MNNGGRFNSDNFFKELISNKGLFRQVFGELLPKLIYSRGVMTNKNYLKKVYKLEDIDDIFIDHVDSGKFIKISELVFRFSGGVQVKKNLLGKEKIVNE